jgi:hypothetical protein
VRRSFLHAADWDRTAPRDVLTVAWEGGGRFGAGTAPEEEVAGHWRRRVLFVIAVAVVSAHLTIALPQYTVWSRLAAIVLFGFVALTFWRWLKDRRPQELFLLAAVNQVYLAHGVAQFTQSTLFLRQWPYLPSPDSLEMAAAGSVVGSAGIFVGWLFGSRGRVPRFLVPVEVDTRSLRPEWLWIHLAIGTAVKLTVSLNLVLLPATFSQAWLVIMDPYLSWILLCMRHSAVGRKGLPIWVYPLAALHSIVGFTVGAALFAVSPWILIVFMKLVTADTIPVGAIITIFLGLVVFNAGKNVYRQSDIYRAASYGSQVAIPDRAEEWTGSFRVAAAEGTDEAVSATASRLAENLPLAQVMEWVPAIVPFREGRNLLWMFLYPVPRVLIPDKPGNMDLFYTEYAETFGYLSPFDDSTRVGTSVFTEGYWHFGWTGLVALSLLLGATWGLVYGGRGGTDGGTLLVLSSIAANPFPVTSVIYAIPGLVTKVVGVAIFLTLMRLSSRVGPQEGSVRIPSAR